LGNLQDAKSSYIESLSIATDTGNRDLEIYSHLGLVVCALYAANLIDFTAKVAELQTALDYEAPIETLYLKLFQEISNLLNKQQKDMVGLRFLEGEFAKLSRIWATKLVKWLIATDVNVKAEKVFKEVRKLCLYF
jgi:hypothetical protein